jgi:NAD(P)-dependent dehydrogenase (short-subunit alcohol dehydrogenase family)
MSSALFDLSEQTAVVIGGTSGLGRAIALGLARAGADVVATSRREEEVSSTADAIEALGRKTLRLTADVRKRETLQAMHDQVIAAFGKVDILINSAGVTMKQTTLDCSEENWLAIFDTNLNGTLRACQIFGASMIERGYGRIVNVASLSTFVAFRDVAAYGASKAAVGSLTKSLAVEWAPYGICVNAIAPGIFPTEMNGELVRGTPRGAELLMRTPMERFGEAGEIAGSAVFLSSCAASFITGEILVVDGGFMASGANR